MEILKFLSWLTNRDLPPATGALRESSVDYRNVYLGSFQKPVGASEYKDVKGMEDLIDELKYFFDQGQTGSCVAHAITKLVILYIYRKTGNLVKLSPRYLYKLCKIADGVNVPGTYPRIGALAATKDGFVTEDIISNDTYLGEKDYLSFIITEEMRKKGKEITMPGFAFVDPTIESIKEAIYQNGAVTLGAGVGDWTRLPLRFGRYDHYVVAYRVEDIKDDYRIYIDNSWGKGWLAKVKKWMFPGRGYFMWSEYKELGRVFDIMVFTDVPVDILEQAKKSPYRFTRNLELGMIGNDVLELQKFLNAEGAIIALTGTGSKGRETSYFGPLTKTALIAWQVSKGILPTGYFGPLSIKEANKRLPKASLVEAIIKVESGGSDQAVGDKHLSQWAYGAMQIRQPMVDDVNKYLKTSYKAEDCLGNRNLTLLIFDTYFQIYSTLVTDEEKARAWNGGAGWKSLYGKKGYENYTRNLDIYWSKISAILNK